jgi:uncharacterized protein YndB with AHSA1/START domain
MNTTTNRQNIAWLAKEPREKRGYWHDLLIAAPASEVYRAITTPQGLQNWWTRDCEIGTRVGDTSTFRFGKTFKTMRIERLQPDAEVRWVCVDANLYAPEQVSRANEWTGTSIVFRLAPESPGQTRLWLEHVGLVSQFQCYEICVEGWRHFLGSLKAYVETGRGTPYEGLPSDRTDQTT